MPGKAQEAVWRVYILKCANGALYTGITNDIERRLKAHRSGKGSKFTRAAGVEKVVFTHDHPNRASASRHESQIKKLTRDQKLILIQAALSSNR